MNWKIMVMVSAVLFVTVACNKEINDSSISTQVSSDAKTKTPKPANGDVVPLPAELNQVVLDFAAAYGAVIDNNQTTFTGVYNKGAGYVDCDEAYRGISYLVEYTWKRYDLVEGFHHVGWERMFISDKGVIICEGHNYYTVIDTP